MIDDKTRNNNFIVCKGFFSEHQKVNCLAQMGSPRLVPSVSSQTDQSTQIYKCHDMNWQHIELTINNLCLWKVGTTGCMFICARFTSPSGGDRVSMYCSTDLQHACTAKHHCLQWLHMNTNKELRNIIKPCLLPSLQTDLGNLPNQKKEVS